MLLLEGERHVVIESSFVKKLRRITKHPQLMVYWHRRRGNWVLGEWVSAAAGIIREVWVWQGALDDIPVEAVDSMTYLGSPTRLNDLMDDIRGLASVDRLDASRQADEAAEELDLLTHVRRTVGGHRADEACWDLMPLSL